MKIHRILIALCFGLSTLAALTAQADGALGREHPVRHVLLISVDGLHALDLSNYVNGHPNSALAELSEHGMTFTNNQTSSPSDSFPGLAALLTGGSPVTTGFWYDVTWNRALSPPAQTDGLGNPGGSCPGQIGSIMAMDESIDTDLTRLDG
ncbi:MAG TPA: alkaline phosphatase family protein, partial [Steroidobacteraceae bacterium]|nr:alkaline phosphatase family protein [Steroidobacteraceae bacterium]